MNLAAIEKRVQALRARLDAMKPKESAPPLVIEFCSKVNKNAPSGTRADEGLAPLPEGMRSFVMVPPGYNGPLPEGVLTLEEWSRWSQSLRKGNDGHVQ